MFSSVSLLFLVLTVEPFCGGTKDTAARKALLNTEKEQPLLLKQVNSNLERFHTVVANHISEFRKFQEILVTDNVNISAEEFKPLKNNPITNTYMVFSSDPRDGDVTVADTMKDILQKDNAKLFEWKSILLLGVHFQSCTKSFQVHVIYYKNDAESIAARKEAANAAAATKEAKAAAVKTRAAPKCTSVSNDEDEAPEVPQGYNQNIMNEFMTVLNTMKPITLKEASLPENKYKFHKTAAWKISCLRGLSEHLTTDEITILDVNFEKLKADVNPAHHIIMDTPCLPGNTTVSTALEELLKHKTQTPELEKEFKKWVKQLVLGVYLEPKGDTDFVLYVIYYFDEKVKGVTGGAPPKKPRAPKTYGAPEGARKKFSFGELQWNAGAKMHLEQANTDNKLFQAVVAKIVTDFRKDEKELTIDETELNNEAFQNLLATKNEDNIAIFRSNPTKGNVTVVETVHELLAKEVYQDELRKWPNQVKLNVFLESVGEEFQLNLIYYKLPEIVASA